MLAVDGEAPGDVLVEHLLPEVLHHSDVLPQLMGGQAGKDEGGRPVIADQPVVVVQGDHAISQAFQHLLRRQVAEVVVAPAPHHDDHHRHGDGHGHRGEVKHLGELAHVSDQHHHRQGGDAQDGPVLAVDLMVRTQIYRPHKGKNAQDVGNHDTAQHGDEIEWAVSNADIVEAVRCRQPLDVLVKKVVPIEKYYGQDTKADGSEDAQKGFWWGRVAIDVDKPTVAQGGKGRAYVLHLHRRHGGLHAGGGQL